MLNSDQKKALAELRKELTPQTRTERREQAKMDNFRGRVIDQTEICYRQYNPPQCPAQV